MSKINGLNQPGIKKYSKKEYIKYLNEVGLSLSDDEFIIGGKMRKRKDLYGDHLYRHDSIAFEVGYSDWKRENLFKDGKL